MHKIPVPYPKFLPLPKCLLLVSAVAWLGCGGQKVDSMEPIDLDSGLSDGLMGGGGLAGSAGKVGHGGGLDGDAAAATGGSSGSGGGAANADGGINGGQGGNPNGPGPMEIVKAVVRPASFDFGDGYSSDVGATKILEFTNQGTVPLDGLMASVEGTGASSFAVDPAACTTAALGVGQSCNISVTFRPTAVGPLASSLHLKRGATSLAVAALSGRGVAQGTLTVSPASLSFGSIAVGEPKTLTAKIKNNSASPVPVTVKTSGDTMDFKFNTSCLANLTAGQECTVHIAFVPTDRGSRVASISFDGGAAGVAVLNLSGDGEGGILQVNPPSWDFGSVQRGQSANKEFVVNVSGLTGANEVGPVLLEVPPGFTLGADGCTGKKLSNGQSCAFTAGVASGGPFGVTQTYIHLRAAKARSASVLVQATTSPDATNGRVIGEWVFDQSTQDSSPHGNHGIGVQGNTEDAPSANAKYASDPDGYHLDLAEQRWVRIPTSQSLRRPSTSGAISAALWMRPATTRGEGDDYAFSWSTTAGEYPQLGIGIIRPEGRWFVSAGVTMLKSSKPIASGWHHVAATCDGYTLRLYIDGQPDGEAYPAVSFKSPLRPVVVGGRPTADGTVVGFFEGGLRGLRLFDRNLAPAEVQDQFSR